MIVTKLGGDKIHLVPRFSIVGGDASHRVVAPTAAAPASEVEAVV